MVESFLETYNILTNQTINIPVAAELFEGVW